MPVRPPCLLHSHGYRLSEMDGQTFIKTDGAGTIRFAVHADDGAGWSNSRVLHKELCSILRGVWPNLQWKNDVDCPMGFYVIRDRGSDQQHALINHRSLTDGAVINMIVPSETDDRGNEQGGSTSADPSPPSQDQGGFDDHEPDEDDVREQVRQAVAANQAENDALLSTLRQRVEALDTPATAPSRLNPFQTPGTVRLQPGGRGPGRGMLLDLNHTPSTHSSVASTAMGPPGASPLLAAFEDGNLSSCAHQVGQAFQPEQQSQPGALTGGG